MTKKILRMILMFTVLFSGTLVWQTSAQAAERDIVVYNGETPDEWEFDDEEYVDEEDLFLPGDTGKVIAETDSWWEEDEIVKTEYVSSNPSVVKVASDGTYTVLKAGTAIISIRGWNEYSDLIFEAGYSFLVGGDVSATTLKNKSVQGYLFEQSYDSYMTDEMVVSLVNAPDLTYCSFSVVDESGSDMGVDYRLDREKKALILTASRNGTAKFTFRLNRKEFTVQIKVVTVGIGKSSALLTQKGKLQLSIKGYSGKIKWVSTNKKVASVSGKGLVRAKNKTGNTLVYAQIGSFRMGCAISVVTPKMKKVINTAKKIGKTCKYSQAKRMSANYYDCSSLVWKSYRKMGKTFGSKNYAPVAADIAKWCAKKKSLIKGGVSEANLKKMKLKAGDLVFQTGSDNKRYKGIYHVEMFTGYRCYGFYGEKPVLAPCYANRYDGYATGAKCVGRP